MCAPAAARLLAEALARPLSAVGLALLDWPDVIRFLEGLVRERLLEAATGEALASAYRALRGRRQVP